MAERWWVLVYEPDCGPCEFAVTQLDELEAAGRLPVPVRRATAAERPNLAASLGVYPTLLELVGSEEQRRLEGAWRREHVISWLAEPRLPEQSRGLWGRLRPRARGGAVA